MILKNVLKKGRARLSVCLYLALAACIISVGALTHSSFALTVLCLGILGAAYVAELGKQR